MRYTAAARATWRCWAQCSTDDGTSGGCCNPFIDYDEVPGYLNSIIDPMDSDGNIPMPDKPGLGEDINFEYIDEHLVDTA